MARRRRARYRRKLLERLWRPTGIRPCGPECPWKPEGEACTCSPERPCDCERTMYAALLAEGRGLFGDVLAGMTAKLLIDSAKAAASGDPKSIELRTRLLSVLLGDLRRREYQEHLTRRFKLEAAERAEATMPYEERLRRVFTAPQGGNGGPARLLAGSGGSSSTPETSRPSGRQEGASAALLDGATIFPSGGTLGLDDERQRAGGKP